ncbi:hypothetical protein FQN54_001472 [Arachnomyces sp. PD_36]|nr:hypothetical protein FQN54_001472 [Arachnomyces sp. PD_36]
MEHTRKPIACLALFIQLAASAVPAPRHKITSSSQPRDVSSSDSDAAGAEGSSSGSINLKKGDEIAIIVVASLVVVIGVASAILYYLAKKRQWQVRASIRRSARRIAEPFTPRTAKKMTHGPPGGARNGESSRRRTGDPNSSSRRTAEQSRRAPSSRTEAERQKRIQNEKLAGKQASRPYNGEKREHRTRDLEKGQPVVEKKPSNPDSSTSNSSSDAETKPESKSWIKMPKLPFGGSK